MCRIAASYLVHKQVLVPLGCHLWQVRDRKHLAPVPQAAQQLANNFRSRPADTDVNFVEYQCRYP